jgi:hypothetical protein
VRLPPILAEADDSAIDITCGPQLFEPAAYAVNDCCRGGVPWHDAGMLGIAAGIISVICDGMRWLWLALRSTSAVEAENLFLRRQLALYIERGVKPRRIDSVTRIVLTILSRFFDWRDALVVVRPETLLRWHRQGWKLFWRLKSRPGRPPIPPRLQGLIRQMARENPLWGEERIANELRLKLGIEVHPARCVSTFPPGEEVGLEAIYTGRGFCVFMPKVSSPVTSL